MTGEDKNKLIAAGYDVDVALQRFMNNDVLFMTFLKKVPDDPHFGAILSDIEAGNYDEAHKNAHAIKGVVGNLGLTSVFDTSAELCVALKAAADSADIRAKYDAFEIEYKKASELIKTLS